MHYNTGSLVSVHLPSGDFLSFALKKTEKAAFQLSDWKEYTSIQKLIFLNSQKLFYKYKLLAVDDDLYADRDCNVFLNLNITGESGECDICFSPGKYLCSNCKNQVTCKECCERVHQHPRRAHHKPLSTDSQPLTVPVTWVDNDQDIHNKSFSSDHKFFFLIHLL